MLLRSSSSPILRSLISVSAETSPGSANHVHLSSASLAHKSSTTLTRATSESSMLSELLPPPVPKRKEKTFSESRASSSFGRQRIFLSSSGLDMPALSLSPSLVMDDGCQDTLVLEEGCVGDGGSGGRICGGGAGGGGRGRGGDNGSFSDSNKSTDAYYQKMIQANPSDPLILGNYAKYLKEVRGDLDKAEEYCERAILASQQDGSVLSMYADIIWEKSKDAERAEAYFDRAVQAAPEDCYVAASYAQFLWDAEEEEKDKEEQEKDETMKRKEAVATSWTQPPLIPGQATSSPLAAAS